MIVADGAFASGVAATLDMLRAAAQLAGASAGLDFEVCSLAGGPVALSSGLVVATSRLGARAERTTWILPGLAETTAEALHARLAPRDPIQLARAIARHLAHGGRVAAACASVFLLQAAGALDGRRATTTWWLGGALARLAPSCSVDTDAMVCVDGPVITAGAAFAQTDLVLHLLRERGGARLADRVARTLVLDGRQVQARYVIPELLANGDPLIARITAEIARSLPSPPSIAALAARLGASERTLSRHVRRVTGHSTIALVHGVRAQRAQALLQGSRMSVEDVAAAVGYRDPGTLRRLLKKLGVGSPRALRR